MVFNLLDVAAIIVLNGKCVVYLHKIGEKHRNLDPLMYPKPMNSYAKQIVPKSDVTPKSN